MDPPDHHLPFHPHHSIRLRRDLGWWQAWVFALLIVAAGILSAPVGRAQAPGDDGGDALAS